jgi:hypothetical protein
MSGSLWAMATQLAHSLAAVAAMVLAMLLVPRRTRGPAMPAALAALVLTGSWALATVLVGAGAAAGAALTSLADLTWLWMLYRLFAHDERDKQVRGIRAVVLALGFVKLLQLAMAAAQSASAGNHSAHALIGHFAVLFSLLFCIGALVLVHNLYLGASNQARETLRWPAAALAAMWLYDLNIAAIAYFGGEPPRVLADLRGAAMLPVLAMLASGLLRHPGARRLQPSRQFAFQSFSLLAIAAYLLAVVLLVQAFAYAGSDIGPVVQVGFLLTA